MTTLPKVARPPRRVIGQVGDADILDVELAPKGGWHHTILDGKPVVVAYCPKCRKKSYLTDHEISDDGVAKPSVICPHEPCDFHDLVQLLGFEH